MNRINLFRATQLRTTPSILDSIAWGKINLGTTASPVVFAATLIICSFAVGCSSEKPKTASPINQTPVAQTQAPIAVPTSVPTTPAAQTEPKPVHKKTVHKLPATVMYADKASGVSFRYPRTYVLKTGNAVNEPVSTDPASTDFGQPGGVTFAAVTVPEGIYPKSDLASALFNVSMNKSLTAEQCANFSVDPATSEDPATQPAARPSKLILGDMELQSTETLATVGTRKEASKYYHVFENGACYEFALKVATTSAETDEGAKHVDRDEVFKRLGKILATVKIDRVKVPDVTASAPVPAAPAAASPAQ